MKTFILSCLAALLLSGPVAAQRYQAAVIGNTNYPAAPLANASRDAAIVAEALARVGFDVRTYFDVTIEEVEEVLAEISEQFEDAEISVIYYAGHAFQFNGQNQLLAADVRELSRSEIESRSIPLSDLLSTTLPKDGLDAGKSLRLVIIDACRNDPFSSLDTDFQRGISFEESGDAQTLIAYSTSAGELAYDGPAGGNGPYALALSRAILKQGGATISGALRSIRRDVRLATEGLQIPWVVGSIEVDPVIGADRSPEVLAPRPEGEIPPLDEIVWSFVSNDLTVETLSRFVTNFPQSFFAPDAQRRMREIEDNKQAQRQLVLASSSVSAETLSELEEARAQIDANVAYEPQTNIPAELFAIWPDALPPTQRGLASFVDPCDRLASDPADPQRVAPPIRSGLVNVREAARACGFALARDPENPRLLFQFGRVLQIAGRHDWARTYYIRASAYDYSAALTNLGFMAIRGIGQDEDFAAAAEFYRQAADLGNLRARTNIGSMYLRGQGLPQLPEEAVLWYRLASGMGWANAQNALADAYRQGRGVAEDRRASAALYHLAAANGQRAAMNNLGRSYLAGWGVEPDRNNAITWFERAIASGDRFAPRNLARELVSGGDATPERIVSLLQLSADRGEGRAYTDLAKLYIEGTIVAEDPSKAYLNARLAELKKVKDAEELVERTRERLDAAAIAAIDAEIEQRRRLNGI